MVRRPGRSGCGFACLSLAGLRSEAFQLLLEVCDFFTEGRDFVFQVGYAVAIGGWNGGIGDGIRGRGRPRHTGICHAGVFRIAGEQVHVARFFGAGLSWKNSCQRRISLHETLQGGLHFGEIFEAVHTFGTSAELAGRLRTAQQEDAEHGSLSAGEVEHLLQAMLVFGDPAVGTARGSSQILVVEAVERLTHRCFIERHDRVAIVFLVAGVDQCV